MNNSKFKLTKSKDVNSCEGLAKKKVSGNNVYMYIAGTFSKSAFRFSKSLGRSRHVHLR
jgi:hypothetical protein